MGLGVTFVFAILFVVSFASVLGGDPSFLRVVGESKSRAIYGQCYLTATNADLLACVDVSSGTLSWRFSLDENQFRDGKKIVAADKIAYVLSYSTEKGGASLYSVSIKDGSLLWSLPISSGEFIGDSVDMTYSRKENSLYVLLHNALHKITTSGTEPSISTMILDDSILPGLKLFQLIDSTSENDSAKRGVAVGCIQDADLKCTDSAVLQMNTVTGDSTEVTKMKSSSTKSTVFASNSAVYRVEIGSSIDGKVSVSLEQTTLSGSQQRSSIDVDFSSLLESKNKIGNIVPQFYRLENVPVIHLAVQLERFDAAPMTLHAVIATSEEGNLSNIFATSSVQESVLVSFDSVAALSQSIRQLQIFTSQPKSDVSLLGGKIRVTSLSNDVLVGNSLVGLLKESEKTVIAEGGSRIAAFQNSPNGLVGKWFRQEALSQIQQAILLPGLTMKTSSSFFGALDAICAQSQFSWAEPLCGVFDSVRSMLDNTETALERILLTRVPHHHHGKKSTIQEGQDHVIAITFDGDADSLLEAPVSIKDLNLQLHSLVFPHDLAALKSLNGGSVEKSVLLSTRRLIGASNYSALVRSVRLLTVPASESALEDGTVFVRVIADLVDGNVISWVASFSLEDDMRSKLGDDYVPILSDSSSAVSAAVKTLLPSEVLLVEGKIAAVTSSHLITENDNADGSKISIVPFSSNTKNQQSQKIPQFVHTISTDDGEISIYESHSQRKVANVKFDPSVEEIVDVAFPVSEDIVYSRVSILGDDNILVKYLNPNMIVVCTATKNVESTSSEGASAIAPQVYLNLIDVVSGNVLQRVVVDSATVPVRAHLMENFVLLSYWNSVSKRAEILTMGLYDGVIGKTDYLPFASKPNVGSREHDEKTTYKQASSGGTVQVSVENNEKDILLRSSYLTSIPLVMQRTYLMPRKVMDIAHTLSRHGLTNKNILLTLESGEVYSLDFRILHPRRPISDPTASEKEEGLMRYGPIFPFLPQMTLTMENNLRPTGRYPTKTLSAPSYLESEALVFVFGPRNDVLFTSVTPSQGFDTLSATFNYTALVGLISLLFVAVMVLRRMQRKTTLKRMWQ